MVTSGTYTRVPPSSMLVAPTEESQLCFLPCHGHLAQTMPPEALLLFKILLMLWNHLRQQPGPVPDLPNLEGLASSHWKRCHAPFW